MQSLLTSISSYLSISKHMPSVCASFLSISQVRAASCCLLLLLLVPTTFPRQAELLCHHACSNIRTDHTQVITSVAAGHRQAAHRATMLLVTPQPPAVQPKYSCCPAPSFTPSGAAATPKKPLTSLRRVLLLPCKCCPSEPTPPAPSPPTLTSLLESPVPSRQGNCCTNNPPSSMLHNQVTAHYTQKTPDTLQLKTLPSPQNPLPTQQNLAGGPPQATMCRRPLAPATPKGTTSTHPSGYMPSCLDSSTHTHHASRAGSTLLTSQ
jgi:hypothetical protein